MENTNYMHDAINESLRDIFATRDDICKCDRCQSHIMKNVISHLCDKYQGKENDKIHIRTQGIDSQIKVDSVIKIDQLIKSLKDKPIH